MPTPLFQKISLKENRSFNVLKVRRPHFVVPWHFHPEFEIMLVLGGRGTRFVGDSIGAFAPLDLVMVGSNLAHVWKNGEEHYRKGSKLVAEAKVILFREDCFGENFFSIPEMQAIKKLMTRSSRGIKFEGETKKKVREMMEAAYEEDGLEQLISFLKILKALALSKEYSLLCSAGFDRRLQPMDLERIDSVVNYLMKNFRSPIKLNDVAGVANMTPTAFCRYFKARTNKTVIQFVNELRIGLAHKLLLETGDTVDQICYTSGFNNVSNFYEQFYKVTAMSPFKFRKEHSKRNPIS